MNHYLKAAQEFTIDHKREFIVGGGMLAAAALIALLVGLFIFNNPIKVIYQPAKACDMLTPAKAQDLLGNKVISVDTNAPVIDGDVATSKCSYTDSNPVQNQMIVAAIAVRSGINDKGVAQNKNDFAAKKPTTGTEPVNNLGDSAYFDQTLGQLNVLKGRNWIIFSYGVGASPEANTLEKALNLAHKVLS
jgi:hypothetical protein